VVVLRGAWFLDGGMQTKREALGYGMTLLPSLEALIPQDHRLYKLNRVVDFSFVHEAVRERYCQDNGRPSVDPEVVLRLFVLQAVEGIRSVRELMREVQVNLAYRWFIGYRLDEALPDHSTLSRALDRIGDGVFNELFERSVAQCQGSGLIEGKVLHLDATVIRADLDANTTGKPGCADAEARFGRFPDGKKRPGYKQQTVADGRNRVVVGVSVTPANCPDDSGMEALVDEVTGRSGRAPEVLCADGAYGSGKNNASMEARGIRLVSPPQKAPSPKGGGYFTVADFDYDERRDEFICPAGERLKFVGKVRKGSDRRKYLSRRSRCRNCALKSQCTLSRCRSISVSAHHVSLVRLRADSTTESFKLLYRSRAPVIEGVFAEAKRWHGLARAWRRGLAKMRVQCLLIAAVINFKRLVAAFIHSCGCISTARLVIEAMWRFVRHLQTKMPILPSNATSTAPLA
jgi:transposase